MPVELWLPAGSTFVVRTHKQIVQVLRGLNRKYMQAATAADAIARNRKVKLLTGPYKGRVCRVENVTIDTFTSTAIVFVTDIPTKDGKDTINFATRKDGRVGYGLGHVEFVEG